MSSPPEPPSTPSALPSSTPSISSITAASASSTATATATSTSHGPETMGYPPMTTHWTAPLSCTWTYNIDSQPVPGFSGAVAFLDLEPVSGATTMSCYPDGMFDNDLTGVFSPGTCPGGWTTAAVQAPQNVPVDEATTTAVCCSSEYSLHGSKCMRSVPTVLAVPIVYNETDDTNEVLTDSTTTLYSATIAVYTIQARFQEDDKELLGLTGADEINTEEPKETLTLSAKVGIGVGVAIFALLAAGLGVFLFFMRKNKSECRDKKRNSQRGYGGSTRDRDDCDASYDAGGIPLGMRRHSHDEPPPPAYEAATERNSHERSSSEGGEIEHSATREDEIRTLREQQAVIQRRIEELGHVETDDTPSGPRD